MMRLRRHALIITFYALWALIALHRLVFHASTHVGGEWVTDYYHFHWNFGWIRHALTHGLPIYQTDYVLFPSVNNLAYHTLTPFWFPLWALIEPLAGTLIAMLGVMIAALTLTGYCTYLWLRSENAARSLALIGGALVQVSSGMMLAAMLTTINYLSLFWLPLCLLIWRQVAERRSLTWALVFGAALYGLLLTDLQLALFLAFLIVPYGVLTVIERPSWRVRGLLMARGVIALIVALALLWFAGPLPHILSADTSGFSPMPIENAGGIPFPRGWFDRFDTYNRVVTLGSLLIPIVIVSLFSRTRDRRRWFWLAVLIPPLILSLGATITIGDDVITMPYTAFHELFRGIFRSPARFDGVIMLAALALVARAWSGWITRSRARQIAVGALGVLLVAVDARPFVPMPIQPVTTTYAFHDAIGRERGAGYDELVVLDIPVAGGSGEAWVGEFAPMQAQFYALAHHKRVINGSLARVPLDHFWHWLYDDPMLAWLGQRRLLEPDLVEPLLRQRIADYPIGYIVVHRDWIGQSAPAVQEIIGYFNSLGDLFCPFAVEGAAVVYRTSAHPDDCAPRIPPQIAPNVYQIDIGSAGDEWFIGWGWHYQEDVFGTTLRWAGEHPQTDLYVELPGGDYTVEIAAQAFHEPRALDLAINDTPLEQTTTVTPDSLTILRFELPADAIRGDNLVKFSLNYAGWRVPAEFNGDDQRRLAIAVDWVRFTRRDDPPIAR